MFARSVVESHQCMKTADDARRAYNRFDEAYEGLKWVLARRGHDLGVHRKEEDGPSFRLYRQASDGLAFTPEIAVLYVVGGFEIEIIALRVGPGGEQV